MKNFFFLLFRNVCKASLPGVSTIIRQLLGDSISEMEFDVLFSMTNQKNKEENFAPQCDWTPQVVTECSHVFVSLQLTAAHNQSKTERNH